MGNNKSCDGSTRQTRQIIVNIHRDYKWAYIRMAENLNCSVKKVFSAIDHYKTHGTVENVLRKARPRKTSPREDSLIVRVAKKDPIKVFNQTKNEVFSPDDPRNISSRIISQRLVEAKFFERTSRNVTLLNKQHRQKRLLFVTKYDWTVREWKKCYLQMKQK
ncbi:uncharacterized protein LOC114251213 [Bombyx mandarina]|uniref:Uncharacterized protein LOC114251213 n=1 Tax=Bombyx mandarina TaxID=7092 RepID=A0A6J2KFV0_BOMMA|nr:uncharacterized protein LOC114251213 [Bombyx mandarina]